MRTVYFDYNATTPLDAAVRTAMLPFLDAEFGNPSSIHHVGRRARAFLDEARDRVARVFACKPSEMIFTSGGTESNNLAVFGVARHFRDKGRHIITSMVEHHALLHPCEYLSEKEGFEVTFLPVDRHGRVSPDDLRKALEGMLAPEKREAELGRAVVQRIYAISRLGVIAGCRVIAGVIARNGRMRVIRDSRIVGAYSIESLKREKDDAREVRDGLECGIKLANFNDIKEGDIFECYRIEEVARTLS